MTAASSSLAAAFTPRAPRPRAETAGLLTRLVLLARNPIELWTERHFSAPVVIERGVTGYPFVTISDPAAIRRVFVDNAANYEKDALQLRVLRAGAPDNAGEGLLVARGELWRRTRRTLAPLFTPRRVATLAPAMRAPAEACVAGWLRRGARAVAIDVEMTELTYAMLSATLFSDALSRDAAATARELGALLDSIGRVHPFDALALPAWAPRFGRSRARAARAWFSAAIDRLIAERRAMIAAGAAPPADILTALIEAADPETGAGLSPAEVAANLFTLIAAGHETTARALAWTLHLLARAPDWQARCAAEAQQLDDDPAQWLDSAPTLRAVFEEAMRLFPPVPFMSRAARGPDRLAGVEIGQGALVCVAPWVLHRHRLLWRDPDVFDPARFLPGAREAIDRFAYLPFGAGPRICIGMGFAMQEAIIALVSILRRVSLKPIGEEPDVVHRITLKPGRTLRLAIAAR
ncbi:MAG: cytochrome P450 [Methylobacteriaceae bacterium]|nr:cytochrome P450 [Methylobacteriaceae bacterium]